MLVDQIRAPKIETSAMASATPNSSIHVQGLNYKFQDGSLGLTNIKLDLPQGSRTLLIGGQI